MYVTSDKHNVRLINLSYISVKKNDKYSNWILYKYSQRPILKEIGLILNNKIREWINIRSTINRYLLPVEYQLT